MNRLPVKASDSSHKEYSLDMDFNGQVLKTYTALYLINITP